MRKLTATICLMFAALLGSEVRGSDLPPCPSDQNQRYHNCFGTYTWAYGAKYVGEWRDEKQHGRGTATFANGDKYVGEFSDGVKNGQGTLTFADGNKYVGDFWDSKFHGQGIYYYADGSVKEGIWADNKFQYSQKVSPTVSARNSPPLSKSDLAKVTNNPGKIAQEYYIANTSNSVICNGAGYGNTDYIQEAKKRELVCKSSSVIVRNTSSSPSKYRPNVPKCDGSPLKFIQNQSESINKQMWCGKLLCPQNPKVRNWNNCIGDYTTQNRTRYIGLWRKGKTIKKGKFTFKNNSTILSDSGYPSKNLNGNKKFIKDRIPHATVIEIKEIQEKLKKLKIYKGQLDGVVGARTLEAINTWLNENGYPSITIVSRDIIDRINIHISPKIIAEKNSPPSRRAVEKENEKLRKKIAELEEQNKSKPKQIAKKPPPKAGTTGSGFFVSKLGHIVTNEHVVRQCGSVTVGDNANKQIAASVLETDKRNDLALLRISSTQMASAETLSLISKLGAQKLGLKLVPLASGGLMRSDDIELGESVLVAGYPYGELYSNTIKVTGGMVSAVKGMGDDSAQFQMDAAVQPGNSGGPIYDENGNIVGVVISQLNKLKVAKTIGSLPENVNFGIKASTVRQFLTSAGLPTKWSNRTERKTTKELAQIAKNQTVMVVCNH